MGWGAAWTTSVEVGWTTEETLNSNTGLKERRRDLAKKFSGRTLWNGLFRVLHLGKANYKDHEAVFDCVCDYVCIHRTVVCTHVIEPGKGQWNYWVSFSSPSNDMCTTISRADKQVLPKETAQPTAGVLVILPISQPDSNSGSWGRKPGRPGWDGEGTAFPRLRETNPRDLRGNKQDKTETMADSHPGWLPKVGEFRIK